MSELVETLRAAAEKAEPITTDLFGDRYFTEAWSTATLNKNQDDFVSLATPANILKLLSSLPPSGPVCCTACGHTEASHMEGACIISTCRCKGYIASETANAATITFNLDRPLHREAFNRAVRALKEAGFTEAISRAEALHED
jgi:hypothetical protein